MKRVGILAVVFIAVVIAPAASHAQGLGDAAARAKQKRKEQPAPAKVFTDADLSKDKPPADAAAGESASADDTAAQPGEAKPGEPVNADLDREREERKLQEAEWRVKFAQAREQVAQAEAACWHEVVRTEHYQGVPVPMEVREVAESGEPRQAKRVLASLEEQFRRTGFPPGWARER